MKIKREDFKALLGRVAPMVKSRTTMPIMSCLKVWASNGFHAVATDGNCFVEASCECDGALIPLCVAPGPLVALSGHGPDTLDLSLDKERLNVKCGAGAVLSVLNAEEFPSWPTEGIKPLGVNTSDLADAIEAVGWAADSNPRSYSPINRRTVWIDMNTKEHSMIALALDGRRLGLVNKSAVVPNSRIIFHAEHAKLLVEALRVDNSSVSTSESWIVVGSDAFRCAINQVEPFEMPLAQFNEMYKKTSLVGHIPRDETLVDLATMQSLAGYEEKVYAKGEISDEGFKLDFVGKTNEFHSVVSVNSTSRETQSKVSEDRDMAMRNPNASAGAKVDNQNLKAQSPICFSFDAALLHDVLKHTPGDNIPCRIHDSNAFFDGDGVVTALALVRD